MIWLFSEANAKKILNVKYNQDFNNLI